MSSTCPSCQRDLEPTRPMGAFYCESSLVRSRRPLPRNPVIHGTRTSYIRGCRRDLCREANTDY